MKNAKTKTSRHRCGGRRMMMSDYETMVCPECCSEEIYFDEDLFGGFGGYFCEDCDASWPILQDYQNSTDITTERDELKAIVEKLPRGQRWQRL